MWKFMISKLSYCILRAEKLLRWKGTGYATRNLKFFLSVRRRLTGGTQVWLQSFLSLALDRGEWLTSRSGRFIPWKRTPLHIEYEAGWAPEQVWISWRREKPVAPTEIGKLNHRARSLIAILTTILQLLNMQLECRRKDMPTEV
jgi:hypothetical protein